MLSIMPGGLLAFEAVVIGMTSAEHVKEELASNLEVLLLLMFMVAGIYFMKQLLLFIFTRLLLSIPRKRSSRWPSAGRRLPFSLPGCADGRCGGDQRRRGVLRHLSPRGFLAPG
jgi:hypothetical protein